MSAAILAALLAAIPGPVAASQTASETVVLTLKDHRFSPGEVTVRAGRRVDIVLVNQDSATEEFDSEDLNLEKFVSPKARIALSVGPLKPGRYDFMGEYHADTASGAIVAVEAND